MIKKIATSILLGLALSSAAFAGSEDWDGQFTFQSAQGNKYTISHSPTRIQFLFFNVGGCLFLGKGSSINGFVIPENVEFCRVDTIDKFTSEVQKLGLIVDKTITVGSTYPN